MSMRKAFGQHYASLMGRVVIVGNGGGGKSTLAKKLSERYDLPWISVDQLQWEPSWHPAPASKVATRLREVIASDRWIIDGWGPWSSLEERMVRSDTIIYVDFPLWMHFWLAAERQIAVAKGQSRSDPVEGCDDLAITQQLFQTIWDGDRTHTPRLQALIAKHAAERTYHHITTIRQLDHLAATG
jgi:adenylate kinase family enzyme